MREVLKLGSFILIFIGTPGLLLNELMFDWGRTATIIFAAINVVGLATLVSTTWIIKKQGIDRQQTVFRVYNLKRSGML